MLGEKKSFVTSGNAKSLLNNNRNGRVKKDLIMRERCNLQNQVPK